MKELVKRTTIPKTLPEDVPSCERLKTEVILDLTEVYLPPPGVALFPVVPVPVPVPGDKTECCPPGQMYDPRTGQCGCPCPEGERPPVTVLGANGSSINGPVGPIGPGPCGSCRRGATFNPQTCSCECPCQGQFLLPGTGCVDQCPEGFSEAYDASNSPPYGCKYCVQYPPGIVVDPIPPVVQCQNGDSCDRCEECSNGICVPRVCKTGFYLDRGICQCLPIADGKMSCTDTEGSCPQCQRCVNGTCQQVITCPDQQRLNLETCQCEPLNGSSKPSPVAPCSDDSECGQGYVCDRGQCVVRQLPPAPEYPELCETDSECGPGRVCRQGKCVKKPPPRLKQRPPATSEPLELPNLLEDTSGQGIPSGGFSIGIGGGTGGGPSGGVQRVPRQSIVPRTPVQRIRRPGKVN